MRDVSAILRIENVSQAFGALRVLTDVTFHVRSGETLGLIGPNGAGKTTLFNIITGFSRPDRGMILFQGEDVSRLDAVQRARAGLVRTFQRSMVFPALSGRENLALAIRARHRAGTQWWGGAAAVTEADQQADELLASAGLTCCADSSVGRLSYGEQRMIDILISLALEPPLLLLDEPTAGLARDEAERLLALIRIHDERTSILLIAHDLDVVFGTCDRIAVLNLGRVVAVDTPAEIRRHDGVRQAYLGKLAEDIPCH